MQSDWNAYVKILALTRGELTMQTPRFIQGAARDLTKSAHMEVFPLYLVAMHIYKLPPPLSPPPPPPLPSPPFPPLLFLPTFPPLLSLPPLQDPYKVTESSTSPLMYGSVGDHKQNKSKQNSARSNPAIGGTLKSSLVCAIIELIDPLFLRREDTKEGVAA